MASGCVFVRRALSATGYSFTSVVPIDVDLARFPDLRVAFVVVGVLAELEDPVIDEDSFLAVDRPVDFSILRNVKLACWSVSPIVPCPTLEARFEREEDPVDRTDDFPSNP